MVPESLQVEVAKKKHFKVLLYNIKLLLFKSIKYKSIKYKFP